VRVEDRVIASIERGILLLVAIEKLDTPEELEKAAKKIAELRIFADASGKMNLDIVQARGSCLVVSQFTLAASLKRGRRPSFDNAAPPDLAETLVRLLGDSLESQGVPVERGRFGAMMEVELVNDGPVTFVLDSA
jgi:D-tyrosyl-tRNA(Tyr) deacylase